MKQLLSGIFVFLTVQLSAQTSRLTKVWETDSILPTPESVLPDLKHHILYVSLIDGDPWAADGKGEIAMVDTSGKIVNLTWATGLNAPKGMALKGKKLYVADISEVVVIDRKTGKVEKTIKVPGAKGLNDITLGPGKRMYVSDSNTGKVFRLAGSKPELFLEDLKALNGLKAVGRNLYILSDKRLLKADANKKVVEVAAGFREGVDGVERTADGNFIVSCWGGTVYLVAPSGEKQILIDTQKQKINSADIGFDARKNILYIPTFFKNSVAAYRLTM